MDASTGKDLSDAVKEAADAVDGTNFDDADTDIDNADTQLDIAENKDSMAGTEADKADQAADEANQAAADADQIAEDTEAVVDEKTDAIENASSTEEAEQAYNEMQSAVSAAQADFDAKLAEYDAAKAAAQAAADKVAEYEQAYQTAVANADVNAQAAADELAAAKAEAQALEEAVAAAKAAVDESVAGALEIKQLEDENNTTSLNWRSEDKLFIAMMKNYYLPEILNIHGASVERIQGKDNNEYNYFLVKYVDDNGEQQTAYYNFKLEGRTHDVVVFEKREVEVKGDASKTPDQYVDEDNNVITKDELAAGLADGTYVDVEDTYYEKNAVTESETLIEDSTVTGTSTTDVSVDETTKQESYKVDADGNLVKEITADVTTITYTGNTFTSEDSYETEAERDEAAALKKAELEANGKEATVVDTEDTDYTASGTYIPAFEAKIDIKKTETVDNNSDAKEKENAIAGAKKDVEKDIEKDGYYILNAEYSDMNATQIRDLSISTEKYEVTGSVTVTYAKVTTAEITYDTLRGLGDLLTGKNGLEAAAKKWVEENGGGIYVGSEWFNWDVKTATIRYVAAAQKVIGDTADTQEAAEAALKQKIDEQMDAVTPLGYKGAKAVAYMLDKNVTSKTEYSYAVNYLEKSGETTENKVIARDTYGDAEVITGEIIQNLNYLNRVILLTQHDTDYRNFVDGAAQLAADYARLLQEAEAANADVAAAQAKVQALQDEIAALQAKGSNLDLDGLNAKLSRAEAALQAAQDKWDELMDKVQDAEETYGRVLDELGSNEEVPSDDNGGSGSNGSNGSNGGSTGSNGGAGTDGSGAGAGEGGTIDLNALTGGLGTPEMTQLSLPNMPAGGAGAANGAGAGAGNAGAANAGAAVVTIEDEAVPLAAPVVEGETAAADDATVTIADEDVPLAAFPTDEEKATMSWWWLLIIAILGATGYKMYKEHQKRKEEAEVK